MTRSAIHRPLWVEEGIGGAGEERRRRDRITMHHRRTGSPVAADRARTTSLPSSSSTCCCSCNSEHLSLWSINLIHLVNGGRIEMRALTEAPSPRESCRWCKKQNGNTLPVRFILVLCFIYLTGDNAYRSNLSVSKFLYHKEYR